MKLTRFDTTNAICTGRAQLKISATRGKHTLSKRAAELLGVAIGDKIILFQDEETPEDWYISKDSGAGFLLRSNGKHGTLCFYTSALGKMMLEALGYDIDATNSVTFPIAFDPQKIDNMPPLFPILTAGGKGNVI